jgi:hypothetical protein
MSRCARECMCHHNGYSGTSEQRHQYSSSHTHYIAYSQREVSKANSDTVTLIQDTSRFLELAITESYVSTTILTVTIFQATFVTTE